MNVRAGVFWAVVGGAACGGGRAQQKEPPPVVVRLPQGPPRVRAAPTVARVELVRADGGHVTGVRVVPTQAYTGLHVVLGLKRGDGTAVLADRRVGFCVAQADAERGAEVPLDEALGVEERTELDAVQAVEVLSVHGGAPCLRPSLRAERLSKPVD
jgi:hypothetical protein